MSILSREEIINGFNRGELIKNPRVLAAGGYDVQPASYDLQVGVIIKRKDTTHPWHESIEKAMYDSSKAKEAQQEVSLLPGQILFIVTDEIVKVPSHMCATVYSKNNLSLKGVLAWTTGHVDPGYEGPIMIRLINLKATPYSIKPGELVYTITFEEIKYTDAAQLKTGKTITKEEAVQKVTDSANAALTNTLFDLALLSNFVKKEEFGRALFQWFLKTFWGLLTFIIILICGLLAAVASGIAIWQYFFTK